MFGNRFRIYECFVSLVDLQDRVRGMGGRENGAAPSGPVPAKKVGAYWTNFDENRRKSTAE